MSASMSKPPFAFSWYMPNCDEIDAHRKQGLRPVVLWLPKSDDPSFVPEAHRQLTELQYDEANEAEEVEKWIESHVDEVLFGEDSR